MPSSNILKIAILILNWNCREKILKCLESVKKAGYIGNTVIADNGSDDGSLEEIRKHFAAVTIVENGGNLGFAEGNNIGIRYLLGWPFTSEESWLHSVQPATIRGGNAPNFILILNPDTEINKNTIPNLLKVMKKDKQIGIAGPKILYPPPQGSHGLRDRSSLSPLGCKNLIWSAGGVLDKKRYSGGLIGLGDEDGGRYDREKEVDYIPGTAMMVRRDVFEKCGLFNPEYFIYYEDAEMSLKARKAGFKLMFVPSAVLIHHESASMGKNSPAQEYYMARNHLLFTERNAPLSVRIRELARLPKTIYEHGKRREIWGIRGIWDYFMRNFGKRVVTDHSTPGEPWLRTAQPVTPGVS